MSQNRKSLGAYYTPSYISLAIAKWAIRDKDNTIIDPTFGGCSFISSAVKVLKSRGNENPQKNIYGTDIDPIAFEHLTRSLPNYLKEHFLDIDFFRSEFQEMFDVVIGNPPYIKHDNIPNNALFNARWANNDSEIINNLIRPNYWVYFILKIIRIVNDGGRVGLVLPNNFISSKYSNLLQRYLKSYFKHIDVIPIKDSIFEYTNESTVVVLMDGFSRNKSNGNINIHDPVLGKDVDATIKKISRSRESSETFRTVTITESTKSLLDYIASKYSIHNMSRYFSVKIGIVTGSKSFFVLTKDKAESLNIESKFLFPVVDRGQELDQLIIDDNSKFKNYILIVPNKNEAFRIEDHKYLNSYILDAPDNAKSSVHAKNRSPWYSLKRIYISDGFIKNVVADKVLIYSNKADLLCTNNILRLKLISDYHMESLSVFSTTSLFQLSALLNSIKYGKGSMKLEPYGISKIYIPYKKLDEYVLEYVLNKLTDLKDYDQKEIDNILLKEVLLMKSRDIKMIQDSLETLRRSRNISTHREQIT